MKISRILKTIFLTDFITGLGIAIKESFKAKKTSRRFHCGGRLVLLSATKTNFPSQQIK